MNKDNKAALMIRNATVQDCQNLAQLSAEVWLDTYAIDGLRSEYLEYVNSTFKVSYFQSLLEQPDYQLLVGEKSGLLQGYILLNLASHYQTPHNGYEIDTLYVLKSCQGTGVGRALLKETARKFGTPVWLYTWTENAANQFYHRLGAKQIGTLSFEAFGNTINNNVYKFTTGNLI
ncbi:GNAT family N-acetyltransferase [Pseudoalteromonas rubra]|nr:GNAT family N-acetyltransferase [Pseudoalteromonas rubra]